MTMDGQNINIEERLARLESRVDLIINKLNLQENRHAGRHEVKEALPELPKESPNPKIQSSKTTNLLPILAVICFSMAGIFLVKLAIESGWLTPFRQWGLLTIFGVALSSIGFLAEKIEKNYRSYLGATGIILLYLSAYSGAVYFSLYSSVIAIALGAMVSLFAFFCFYYYQEEKFAVISTIGTYIAPVVLGREADFILLSGFFLIWAALFSLISAHLKSRTLTLLGSYLGLGIFLFLNMKVQVAEEVIYVIVVQCMQFFIYAGGVLHYSLKNNSPLNKSEAMAYLPMLLFFYGTMYYLLNLYNPVAAPWVSLAFCAVIYLLYAKAKENLKNLENLGSRNLVHSFLGVVIFHSGYMQVIPDTGKVWLLPLIILASYICEAKDKFGNYSKAFKIMFSAIAIIEFFTLCFNLIGKADLLNIVPALATVAIGGVYYFNGAKNIKGKEGLYLGLTHVLCVLAFYRLAYDYGSLAVTALWGLYSVGILTYGFLKKDAIVAKSSIIVLGITSLKALIYDVSMAPSFVRILSLILTGAILYGAGYLFQKVNTWEK